MEKRIWAVYIFHKFLSQIVFPAWFSATPAALYMRLHVQLAPGPAHFSQHRPRFRPAPYSPPKKKTLFSFGSHFRSFCVVHFTFHSVHSECVSHPLVRVLRGYFAKLLRHYFPCVSVCVFFFYSFFLLLEKYIYVYIFFFCLDYALLALFEIISLPPGGRLVIHVVWLQCVCTRLAMQW